MDENTQLGVSPMYEIVHLQEIWQTFQEIQWNWYRSMVNDDPLPYYTRQSYDLTDTDTSASDKPINR